MKRFVYTVGIAVVGPLLVLISIYIWSDPFRTLKPFSYHYFSTTNRDYLSSELYLKNNPKYHYDSFVFGSSRAGGINSYLWKSFLPDTSRQFVFQGWSETITGIKQKLEYIDNSGEHIANALILLDIPGSFSKQQEPKQVLSIKHYKFSQQSFWLYQGFLFYGFIKPSFIYKSIKEHNTDSYYDISFDTISNDWEKDNMINVYKCPNKDSLKNCSNRTRDVFLRKIQLSNGIQPISTPLINKHNITILEQIHTILKKHNTQYKIIISPGYYLTSMSINHNDYQILQKIFGKDNVYDFSTQNELNTDYNNFSDPIHFSLYVGYQIIYDVYSNRQTFFSE